MDASCVHSNKTQRGPSSPSSPYQEAGHFLLLVCTRAALACALTPEGRLHMLHVFLPPHNTPADCSPYAAWRLASGGRPAAGGQPPPVVVTLAVAWQHSVSAYSATLLQQRATPAQQGQQPPTPPAPLPPPTLLRSWVAAQRGAPSRSGSNGSLSSAGAGDSGICGCCFLDSGPLVRTEEWIEVCGAAGAAGLHLYQLRSHAAGRSCCVPPCSRPYHHH